MTLKKGDTLHIYTEGGKIKLKMILGDQPFENVIPLEGADLLFEVKEEDYTL